MIKRIHGNRASSFAAFLSIALALALVVAFLPASRAAAYYSFGTVSVSTGSSSLSVTAGSSAQTSLTVTPASDDQTLGCGMAKCPQVCTSDGALDAGYTCFDTNGQCTCAGRTYSTYYPETSVQSSNSAVATATVSGGTLVVTGHSAGSATITVNATLRQWESNSTTVQVQVEDPATPDNGANGGSNGSDAGNGAKADGGTSQPSATTQNDGSSAKADSAASAVAVPEAAKETDSRDDALNETVVETVAGKVYKVEKNAHLNTAEQLAKIAGTKDQLVIWSGSSSDKPDYSWTFVGSDVDVERAKTAFDPTVTISKLGTGDVSNIMKQAHDGLVMEFSHSGMLPAAASLYVKVSGTYADGAELSLFTYNEQTKRFELAQDAKVRVEGGYASFKIDHCSSWALSSDDLSTLSVQETNTPRAIASDKQASVSDDSLPEWVIPAVAGGVVVLAVVAGVVAYVLRRRRAQAALDAQGDAEAAGEKAADVGAGVDAGADADSAAEPADAAAEADSASDAADADAEADTQADAASDDASDPQAKADSK